jgi:hypothetical protein
MLLLSLKPRRQQESRGRQQPPEQERKMIAKECVGGTQQSTNHGTQKVWRCECGNANRLGGGYYNGSTAEMREEDDEDGRWGGAEVTRRRRRTPTMQALKQLLASLHTRHPLQLIHRRCHVRPSSSSRAPTPLAMRIDLAANTTAESSKTS